LSVPATITISTYNASAMQLFPRAHIIQTTQLFRYENIQIQETWLLLTDWMTAAHTK